MSTTCDGECGRTIVTDGDGSDGDNTAIYYVECAQCARCFCDRCVASDAKRATGHCSHCQGTLEHQTPGSATRIVFAAEGGEATTQMFDRNSIADMLASGTLSMPDGESAPPDRAAKKQQSTAGAPRPSGRDPHREPAASPAGTRRTLTIVLVVAIVVLLGGLVAVLAR